MARSVEEVDQDEIVVGKGKVVKVEFVPLREGVAEHTEALIDFGDGSKLMQPGDSYRRPTSIQKLVLQSELLYGKQYEVILREVKPKSAFKENARLIRTGE